MMKLRLLLCYALAVSTVCLAVDEEELEETADAEIVSNPIEAMGEAPRAIAKRVSQETSLGFVNTGTDPYAGAQQSTRVEVPTGDPYAKNAPKIEVAVGDPYVAAGMTMQQELPKALPVPVKKAKKSVPKKKKNTSLERLVAKKGSAKAAPAKAPKKEAFIPREQLTLASALFKSVSGDDTIMNEAQAAVRAIENEVKSRESKIKAVAEESLVSVKREISEQAEQLREQADQAARALKNKTESQVQALLETAEDRIKQLNTVVVQESVKLKQDAAKKALVVIDDMEQRAAQRRIEERKKMLAATFGLSEAELVASREVQQPASPVKEVKKSSSSAAVGTGGVGPLLKKKVTVVTAAQPVPAKVVTAAPISIVGSPALRVSAEWKNDLSRRFYQDMSTMKNIIVDAESPVEANDFLKKFEEQNKWFDLTLRSTRQVTDDLYSQLISKQTQMGRLMSSQRVADEYLNKFTKNMIMDPMQFKKMRLGVLYELNARMQQRASHLDRSVRESALPEEEIKTLVKRTLSDTSQQFREIAAQFPDVELGGGASRKPQLSLAAVPLRAMQLEEELGEVRAQAQATQQELAQTQQLLTQAQKGLTETQEVVKKTEEMVEQERLAKEKLAAQNTNITNTTFELLGRQARETTEAELAMTGIRQDSDLLKGELAQATTQNVLLKAQKSSLVGAVESARKDALNNSLQRSDEVSRAQKTVMVIQGQARTHIRHLKESGAKVALGLTADLRQAHEKIAQLSVKQSKLVKELEQQRKTTASLKASLRVAQEEAGRSSAEAVLIARSRGDSIAAMKRQAALRDQAEKRAKITEELAQQTIDSINGFLKTERKSLVETRKILVDREKKLVAKAQALNEHEEGLSEQQGFLASYREQLERDRDMLESLKLETRKVVQHSADLSDSLSDDFVHMQEQIENELRQAQQETKRELLVARERFDKLSDDGESVKPTKKLAADNSDDEIEEDLPSKGLVRPAKKAVMPGVKQLALKQQAARMPGVGAQSSSERSL